MKFPKNLKNKFQINKTKKILEKKCTNLFSKQKVSKKISARHFNIVLKKIDSEKSAEIF